VKRRRDRKKGGKKEKEGAVETGNGSVVETEKLQIKMIQIFNNLS